MINKKNSDILLCNNAFKSREKLEFQPEINSKLFAFRLNRTISVKRFLLTFSNFHLSKKYRQKCRSLNLT